MPAHTGRREPAVGAGDPPNSGDANTGRGEGGGEEEPLSAGGADGDGRPEAVSRSPWEATSLQKETDLMGGKSVGGT